MSPDLDAYIIVMPQLLGQWQHLFDDVPAYLLLVLQLDVLLVPLLFLVICYFTDVLLVVGHIYLLCSDHGNVASLVTLMFWCSFSLFVLMVELSGLDW